MGNALFPLMEDYDHLFVYACDFSPRGVEYVKVNCNNLSNFHTACTQANNPFTVWTPFLSLPLPPPSLPQSNPQYDETRCYAFQCDLTSDKLTDVIPAGSVHLVTLLFVLSAIAPDKMAAVVSNLHSVLQPGGQVLLRDYGLFDHAMLRFGRGHKIQEQFYVRQDGTRAYYFSQGQQLASNNNTL